METTARNRVMTVLFLGVLMGALDIAIVGPALPAIRAAFGVDERAGSWIFTIYVFFNLIGAPLMAKLSDRYGRRAIYLLNIVLFAAGSLLVAAAPAFAVLLLGRALQGLSAGAVFPVAGAVIGDTFPPEKQGGALGLIGAVWGLAFIVGPVLAIALLRFTSWHWLFLINLPLALVVILLGARDLPGGRVTASAPFDAPGMLLLTVLLGGLTIGISQVDTASLGASLASAQIWPFLLVSLLALPAFVWAERRAGDPLLHPGLLGTRQLVIASALAAGAGLGEAAMVFLPDMAGAAFGMTASAASTMLLPVVLAMFVGSPLAGRLLNQLGSKLVILAGSIMMALGVLLLSFFGATFWLFIVAGVLIGLGLSALLGAPVRFIMLNEAPAADRAAAQGAITVFTGVGQLVSGALVGAVAASQGGGVAGYSFAFLCVGLVAVLLVLLAFGLKSRAEERRAGEAEHGATPAPGVAGSS